MGRIEEAKKILNQMGLPKPQQNEMAAFTLLALCGLGPNDSWRDAGKKSLEVSKGIMAFIEAHYDKSYAPNTRETVRRQVLHQFLQAKLADYNPNEPALATNSPRAHYALTDNALEAIRTYGTSDWKRACKTFLLTQGSLREKYGKKITRHLVPVRLPEGSTFELSPGEHNVVQAAVVEQFIPRFAPGSLLLYLGDTAKKNLYVDEKALQKLGITLTDHDKLPDVVFYDPKKKRIFLVEAVTSHGPMSPKRYVELAEMLSQCPAKMIFVSAFPNFREFRKHMRKIAWETEVWIVEEPDHMIHFDGEKFLALS